MKRIVRVAGFAAAFFLAPPVAAQKLSTLPAAATLTGSEAIPAAQGAGCSTQSTPCTTVATTPAQLATYLAPTFQPLDADLTAIAALVTMPFGRSVLTMADAPSIRTLIGVSATGADTSYAKITGAAFTGALSASNFTGSSSNTNTGDQTITLTGDVTGSGTGSIAATLKTVNSAPATCGSASAIPTVTVNAKGLTTACTTGAALATVATTGADTDLVGAAWNTYTPTVTGAGGTLANTTATGRYKRIGKTVFVVIRITMGASPGCSGCGAVLASLPFASFNTGVGTDIFSLFGREVSTGAALQAYIASNATSLVGIKLDGSYPGGPNYYLEFNGTYEAS